MFSEARLSAEIGGPAQGTETAADAAAEQGALLAALADVERFLAVRRALDTGIFDPPGVDRDADFAFGLDPILDGIERPIAQRASGPEMLMGRR